MSGPEDAVDQPRLEQDALNQVEPAAQHHRLEAVHCSSPFLQPRLGPGRNRMRRDPDRDCPTLHKIHRSPGRVNGSTTTRECTDACPNGQAPAALERHRPRRWERYCTWWMAPGTGTSAPSASGCSLGIPIWPATP